MNFTNKISLSHYIILDMNFIFVLLYW